MKKLKMIISIIAVLVLAVSLVGCGKSSGPQNTDTSTNTDTSSKKLKVVYAQRNTVAAWLRSQTEDLQEEAAARGIELIITDANDNQAKQLSDVEDLLTKKPDFIVYPPIEFEGGAPAFQMAKDAGVPLILLGNIAKSENPETDYVTAIQFDFKLEGKLAGEWLAKETNGKARIVEITGIPGSEPAIMRQEGFMEAIKAYPDMKVVASQTANFKLDEAQKVMENILQSKKGQFDVVYAHTDEMAMGVIAAIKGAGLKPGIDIKVVGIDGQKKAVQALADGEMNAIVTCDPKNGKILFDTIEKIVKGEKLDKQIIIPDYVIDATNVKEELPKAF